jgi:hypothetical protein
LQLRKGLEFLHSSARLIHSNLNLETVIINSEAYAELNLVVNREIGKFLGWAKPFP